MKRLGFILLAIVMSATFTMAQNGKKAPKGVFKTQVHDFGRVAESSENVTCEFVVKNEGDAPLIIQRVQTTCGCTTPNYTTEPILPGKEGVIKVTYSTTGRPGAFSKKVTVFSNVPDEVYTLTVKGEVIRK